MGTSNAYGGAGGGTPLIPSWLQGDGGGAGGGATPPGDGAQPLPHQARHPVRRPSVPPAPAPRPAIPAAGEFRSLHRRAHQLLALREFGGSDRRGLGPCGVALRIHIGGRVQVAPRSAWAHRAGPGPVSSDS